MPILRHLDYPPVWLLALAVLAHVLGEVGPDLAVPAWPPAMGTGLVGTGLALMAAAGWEFMRARTTIVPHRAPGALITSGVFRYSRNPIYLADVLILAGLILRWEAWLALPLVPALVVVLDRRFIRPEEARLRAGFGAAAEDFMRRTRRWL